MFKKKMYIPIFLLLFFECFIILSFISNAHTESLDGVNITSITPESYIKLADTPWPCQGQNLRHTGQSPYIGAQTDHLNWSYMIGDQIAVSSPAIGADGTIYVGSGGKVYAFTPYGDIQWSCPVGRRCKSTPVIGNDGTIYIGCSEGWHGKICALTPYGEMKWSYTVSNDIDTSPALGDDGTIYIGGHDGKFYAFDPDGHLKWNCTIYYWIGSSPAIGPDGTIYVGAGGSGGYGRVYAINPNGTIKWTFPCGCVVSSPAVEIDGTIYVGSYDKNLYAFDPNGSVKWTFRTGDWIDSSPAIAHDGTIYIGSRDSNLYAINPNGGLKWTFKTGGSIIASPAIGADGTVYIGSYDHYFYAVNPDGSLKWKYKTRFWFSQFAAIDDTGTVYVGSHDGILFAFGGQIFCYSDEDGDGYGDPNNPISANPCPEGYVMNDLDCNDQDDQVYFGAVEICDGQDNDCNPETPGEDADVDNDGFSMCEGDLDENDPTVYPGAPELCDGKDNDCDLIIPENELDEDMDDYMPCQGDCDDLDPIVHPGAPELCDGKDNDCDLVIPENELDEDMDGYMACEGDCDDQDAGVHPGQIEVLCNRKDDDCTPSTIDCPLTITAITPNSSTNELPIEATIHGSGFTPDTGIYLCSEELTWQNASGAGLKIPRTGQTTSYYPGDDGDLQIGIEWPQPRFTDNGDGTLMDELTGLMWFKDASVTGTSSWNGALEYCSNAGLGGYTDWRLPNILEMFSLFCAENFDPPLPTDHMFVDFKAGCVNGIPRRYWVSNSYYRNDSWLGYKCFLNVTDFAWSDDPKGGWYDREFYFIPVRGEPGNGIYDVPKTGKIYSYAPGDDGDLQKGLEWPNPRFIDNGDGTITDTMTNLMWTKDAYQAGTKKTWEEALTYCNALEYAGYTDWHLPNVFQLSSIIDFEYYEPDRTALPPDHPFINTDHNNYWTSTSRDETMAYVFIKFIQINTTYGCIPTLLISNKSEVKHVWPVRVANNLSTCLNIINNTSGEEIDGIIKLATTFTDTYSLQTTIPALLPPAMYHIIAKNPGSEAEVLQNGFQSICIDCDNDGYSEAEGDCSDHDATVYPGAPELCDGKDNDCDLIIPENELDEDMDGYMPCQEDYDDYDATVYPGAPELCDGKDNDCDLVIPENELDEDMDGYMACEGDCDDQDAGVHPGQIEVLCNGKDDDCTPSTIDCPLTINAITPNSSTNELPIEATIHGSGFTLQSQVHLLMDDINFIGNYDTPGTAQGVTVSGNYAYVADGFSGFHIIDISDPQYPLYVGGYDTPDEAWEIALKGDYALVADGKSGLLVFDITDPSNPIPAGGYQILGHPWWLNPGCDPVHMGWTKGITIRGDYAYMSDGPNGIHILDVTDPEDPIPVGSYNSPNAYAQALKGNYTYVVNYSYGLQVIDISNPSDPQIVFTEGLLDWLWDMSDFALDISINNNYAYLTSKKGLSLQVIDITNPFNPFLIGGCNISDDEQALLTNGEYAFVVGGQKGLHIVEISNPADPLPLKTYYTPGRAGDIAISGQYIYIADGESGLQIIEGMPRSLSVSYIDPFTLKVVIPENLSKGLYDIMVLNPDGSYRILHEGFAHSCTDCDHDGYSIEEGDCNDLDEWIYPGAQELCDGKDNDCDQMIPEYERDADYDGYMICEGDCDDQDAGINPEATEIDDGRDNDCDGLTDEGSKWDICPPIYPPITWIYPPWIYPQIEVFPKLWGIYPITPWKPYGFQKPSYFSPWFIQPGQSWINSHMKGFEDYQSLFEMPFEPAW